MSMRRRKLESEAVAHQFFKYDYNDRGMLKWGGFFLSDHTKALKHEAAKANEPTHAQMPQKAIGDLLMVGWNRQKLMKLQLNMMDDQDEHLMTVTGMIAGYEEDLIVIEVENQYQTIRLDEIRWVKIA